MSRPNVRAWSSCRAGSWLRDCTPRSGARSAQTSTLPAVSWRDASRARLLLAEQERDVLDPDRLHHLRADLPRARDDEAEAHVLELVQVLHHAILGPRLNLRGIEERRV